MEAQLHGNSGGGGDLLYSWRCGKEQGTREIVPHSPIDKQEEPRGTTCENFTLTSHTSSYCHSRGLVIGCFSTESLQKPKTRTAKVGNQNCGDDILISGAVHKECVP
jgi:hypothetical protein